jgi:hypothetical protein
MKNNKSTLDRILEYFDSKQMGSMLIEPKKSLKNTEETKKTVKKLLEKIEALLKRLENIFNISNDGDEKNMIANEIKFLLDHKNNLTNKPENIFSTSLAFRSIAGISQAITLFEAFYNIEPYKEE